MAPMYVNTNGFHFTDNDDVFYENTPRFVEQSSVVSKKVIQFEPIEESNNYYVLNYDNVDGICELQYADVSSTFSTSSSCLSSTRVSSARSSMSESALSYVRINTESTNAINRTLSEFSHHHETKLNRKQKQQKHGGLFSCFPVRKHNKHKSS